jgi:hypothetical protein
MKTKSRKTVLRTQVTQKTTLRRTIAVCALAVLMGGGVFTYLNMGTNTESKAAAMNINIVEDNETLTQLTVDQLLISRSAMNYSANDQNQINVREMK